MGVVFPSGDQGSGDIPLSLADIDFEYLEIDKLPYYWRLKIRGAFQRRAPACPYDGGGLVKTEKPIDHLSCVRCGRNYA